MVVEHVDEESAASFLRRKAFHPVLALLRAVERIRAVIAALSVVVTGAQAAGVDGRERPLPDAALVGQRLVRVPRDRHRVRERREGARRLAVVVRGLAVAARSLRMRVLDVEERLRARQLVRVFTEPRLDGRLHRLRGPLRPDEVVSLHALAPDELPLLVEKTLPDLGGIVGVVEHVRGAPFVLALHPPRVEVVVAGDEQLRDGTPVRALVAGEHLVPDRREARKLGNQAGVRDVARHHDRVDALRVEPPQRLLEVGLLVPRLRDVHVAHDAQPHVRLARGERARRQDHAAQHRQAPAHEPTPCQS